METLKDEWCTVIKAYKLIVFVILRDLFLLSFHLSNKQRNMGKCHSLSSHPWILHFMDWMGLGMVPLFINCWQVECESVWDSIYAKNRKLNWGTIYISTFRAMHWNYSFCGRYTLGLIWDCGANITISWYLDGRILCSAELVDLELKGQWSISQDNTLEIKDHMW